jgi:hypothetical protein
MSGSAKRRCGRGLTKPPLKLMKVLAASGMPGLDGMATFDETVRALQGAVIGGVSVSL